MRILRGTKFHKRKRSPPFRGLTERKEEKTKIAISNNWRFFLQGKKIFLVKKTTPGNQATISTKDLTELQTMKWAATLEK
jgi:hypothetical protein